MIRLPGRMVAVPLLLSPIFAVAEERPETPQAGMPGPGAFAEQAPPPADEHPATDHEGSPPIGDLSGHFELVPALLKGLTAQDSAVRARCAFLLGQIGSRKSSVAVRALLHDPSRAVRYQAGIALGHLGDDAGLPAAGAALASAAEWVRYYAVHGLAGLATDRARSALESLRPGQPTLIAEQIDEVLEAWPTRAVPPARAAEKMGPYDSLHELFIDAGGTLVVESDRYWHKGKYLQCVRCNQAAVFLDPQYVDLYSNSAWLLWSSGLDARAASILRQGVDANSKDPEAWFNFGYHYMLKREYSTAAHFLGRAVELGVPAISHRQYCHALEKSGHPDLALSEWRVLLETHADDPIAPRHIARLKEVLGQG